MPTIIDSAGGFPSAQSLKANGHIGIIAYVSSSRPGSNFKGKPITKQVADAYRAAGIKIASVWQYGKHGTATPSDHEGGYDAGFRMGKEALRNHFAAGGSGYSPIYFAVDFDMDVAEWNRRGVAFFKGVNAAIGKEWTGIYGSSRVCAWAIEDDVIGGRNGKRWAWQTRSWSGGEREPAATLFQRIIDTAKEPGPKIEGITVDVNDVLAEDFGQWDINRAPAQQNTTPQQPEVTVPVEIDQTDNSPNSSGRYGGRLRLWVMHTQEGDGTAQSLTNYLKNPNSQVSYHYSADNDTTIAVVDTDRASWSVLDANGIAINWCFAGSRAAQSRDVWINRYGRAIDNAAYFFIRDAKKYAIENKRPISWDEISRGIGGATDHYGITKGLRIGNHTDVGPNFPWDVFTAACKKWFEGTATPAPKPVENLINKYAADPVNSWIGKRIDKDEQVCGKDRAGRFVKFENAYVYFHPATGAHAIPNLIFEVWAAEGYESGWLGYPDNERTDLKDGAVQGFERGAIYYQLSRKQGFPITGEIRKSWNFSGFEGGPLGYPTGKEYDYGTSGKAQNFEHGTIVWPNRDRTVTIMTEANK